MKKKLRKIVIDDTLFWWNVDLFYHANYCRILRIHIWGSDKTGQPLFVNLTSKHMDYDYPLPGDIRNIVIYALAHGWHPEMRGAVHWLTEEHHRLELANWLLTDIGHLTQTSDSRVRKEV